MGSAASTDSRNVPIPHESPTRRNDENTNDAPSIGELECCLQLITFQYFSY